MKYLKISNKGKIEIEALTLIGASTKRDDSSKIGMFGSGNKYAIAHLVRNNMTPIVFSGSEQIDITTVSKQLRDESFEVLHFNGEPTSITTQMGFHWKLWMAIRELYANAQDEGLTDFVVVDETSISPEDTSIFIPMTDELSDFMFNIDDYFSMNKKVLFESPTGKILKKHSSKARIYRRGILVYETEMDSVFDYDLYDLPINEDRVVQYNWYIWELMYKLMQECDNESIIRSFLTEGMESKNIEANASSVSTVGFTYLNDAWDNVLKDKNLCPKSMGGYVQDTDVPKTFFIVDKLYNAISQAKKEILTPRSFRVADNGTIYKEVKDADKLYEKLADVMDFFIDCKFPIPYSIIFGNFKDGVIMGCADEDKIVLSPKSFDKGIHYVANVIIEELIHIRYKVEDETRAFQDSSIDLLLTYMKKIHDITL